MTTTPDVPTQWAKLLPAGAYLTFKTFSAIVSNNGTCGITEKILTGTTIFVFSLACAISTFTDSYVAEDGRLYYGIATSRGLWNPVFQNSGLADVSGSTYGGGGTTYILKKRDFVNSVLAVLSFATLSLLSRQTIDCLYGSTPSGLSKVVPILVAGIVCFIFAFSPPGRNGIGYAVNNS